MSREKNKLTNMVWRSMGESILLGLIFFAVIFYFLNYYGYIKPFESWVTGVKHGLTLMLISIGIGAVFGYMQSHRIKGRLEKLQDSMLLLEKGNLSKSIPSLGEDEVGRLGEQLNRISKKWEEQVNTLRKSVV